MKMFDAEIASDDVYGLGEGPVWDAARQRVLWVDINAGCVHSGVLRGGHVEHRERVDVDGTVGAVVCAESGELLVAGRRHLHTIALDGRRTSGARLIPDGTASRLNDGKCDPAGRFLVGSLALDGRTGEETLWRIDGATTATVLDDDLTLSNGLGWSPDGTSMYSIDTVPRRVWVRDYDPETGHAGRRAPCVEIAGGSPDGMCVDASGHLWIAIWGAGEVRCFTPTGEHLATVRVAAPNTSSVAFVGPDLGALLITTAREQLSAAQLVRFPDAGRLFTVDVGVRGLPVPPWAGW